MTFRYRYPITKNTMYDMLQARERLDKMTSRNKLSTRKCEIYFEAMRRRGRPVDYRFASRVLGILSDNSLRASRN